MLFEKIIALQSVYGQAETARRVGVSARTLRRYISGQTTPNKKTQTKINRVYGQFAARVLPKLTQKETQKLANTVARYLVGRRVSTREMVDRVLNGWEDYDPKGRNLSGEKSAAPLYREKNLTRDVKREYESVTGEYQYTISSQASPMPGENAKIIKILYFRMNKYSTLKSGKPAQTIYTNYMNVALIQLKPMMEEDTPQELINAAQRYAQNVFENNEQSGNGSYDTDYKFFGITLEV